MLRIDTETDIERLRQMAQMLQTENDRLHTRLRELHRRLERAEGRDAASLQIEIELLEQQLDAQRRRLFGPSSEKTPREKGTDDNAGKEVPRKGHGPRAQPSLPVVEEIHVLDDADCTCPGCGGTLEPWDGQFEESEEVDLIERSFRLVRHKRQKYRCGCGERIETALGPPRLTPGGRYSIDFAVAVAVGKYADHLPLTRQVRQMEREGLSVSSQTLWDQIDALARHLGPSAEAIRRHVLSRPVVGADETTWRLMGKSNGGKTWWAWSVSCPDGVSYLLQPTRSTEGARRLLGDYRGTVVADGYGAYQSLQRDGPARFDLAACWAHVRRKFREAEPHFPEAAEMLDKIRDLYEIEAEGRRDPERLGELRRTRSRKILADIRAWLLERIVLPRSSLGKAVGYALGLWTGLERFANDPRIPIDNNHTERAIRGVALGRKNHYGSRSLRGTQVAALFYSLVESAKLAGVEPRAYITEATRRAIARPRTATLPTDLLSA